MALNVKPGKSRRLVVGVLVACLVLAVSFVVLAVQAWSGTAATSGSVGTQRQGVAYLRPLIQLIGTLAEAQSAAVRGAQPGVGDLRTAVNAVDTVDHAQADALGTRERWTALRTRIDALPAQAGRGAAAYRAYTETAGLVLDLVRKIGDTSKLTLAVRLDSFYLVDAALLRLPEVVVNTGRATDLAVLAGNALSGENAVQVAVARNRVAAAAEGVGADLRRADEVSTSATLGVNVTTQLDLFRNSVAAFAPPTIVASFSDPVTPAALVSAAQGVLDASGQLSSALLAQLDTLLRADGDALAAKHALSLVALAVAVLCTVALMILLAGGRRPVTAEEPVEDRADDGDDDADEVPEELVDIREMALDEVVHLGRAVRPQVRERAGDAL
jgi:hypothetical protein